MDRRIRQTLTATPAEPGGLPLTLVPAPDAPEKTVRVDITLPEAVLRAIDQAAEQNGMTRSGFLVRAAKKEMAA